MKRHQISARSEKQEPAPTVKQARAARPKTTAEERPCRQSILRHSSIFSLNSSALVQLGMMEDPMTGQKAKNLPLAKQTIDVISMLEEKTRGTWMPMRPPCSRTSFTICGSFT
jgi:hypothetical protein